MNVRLFLTLVICCTFLLLLKTLLTRRIDSRVSGRCSLKYSEYSVYSVYHSIILTCCLCGTLVCWSVSVPSELCRRSSPDCGMFPCAQPQSEFIPFLLPSRIRDTTAGLEPLVILRANESGVKLELWASTPQYSRKNSWLLVQLLQWIMILFFEEGGNVI